jgi:hypothetical protein
MREMGGGNKRCCWDAVVSDVLVDGMVVGDEVVGDGFNWVDGK